MDELEAITDREASVYIARLLQAVQAAEDAGFTPVASTAALRAISEHAVSNSRGTIGEYMPGPLLQPPLFLGDRHPWLPSLSAKRSYHMGDPDSDTWDFLRVTVHGSARRAPYPQVRPRK
jgi:hypothetical protein